MSIKDEYPKLELRGKYYRIKDYVDRQRLRISTKTTSRLEAEKALEEYKINKISKTSNQSNGVVLFDKVALMFIQDKERRCKPSTIK